MNEWESDRDFSVLLSCGCIYENKKGQWWRGSGPEIGHNFHCQRCGSQHITAIRDPHGKGTKGMWMPSEPKVSQTDPVAAVSAWAERMNLRHGPVVFDQITRTTQTWFDALAEIRYPGKKWLVSPLFQPADIDYAERWEEQTWPSDAGWPHRYVPMNRVDHLRHCTLEDHTFEFVKDPGDTEIRLVCQDPCPRDKLVALWVGKQPWDDAYDSNEYTWNPCVTIPDAWDERNDFRAYFSVNIPVKLEQVTEQAWVGIDGNDYETTFYPDPVFEKNDEVCPGCGRAMRRPRVALSRRAKDTYVCPRCGQREAIEDWQANKLVV